MNAIARRSIETLINTINNKLRYHSNRENYHRTRYAELVQERVSLNKLLETLPPQPGDQLDLESEINIKNKKERA